MSDESTPRDNFRSAVGRTIWSHSNLSAEDRAAVLREFAEELENSERFEDKEEHIRVRLREMGYTLPETEDE